MITSELRHKLNAPNAPFHIRELGRCLRNFQSGLRAGIVGEHDIDIFLEGRGDTVEEAPKRLQEFGIDRIWMQNVGGLPYIRTVEYKTDFKAHITGNLFLETQIRERDGSLSCGWFRYSVAQVLIFYIPAIRRLLIADTQWLREWIFAYGKELRHTMWVENEEGHAARGILVPVSYAKENLLVTEIDMESGEACR